MFPVSLWWRSSRNCVPLYTFQWPCPHHNGPQHSKKATSTKSNTQFSLFNLLLLPPHIPKELISETWRCNWSQNSQFASCAEDQGDWSCESEWRQQILLKFEWISQSHHLRLWWQARSPVSPLKMPEEFIQWRQNWLLLNKLLSVLHHQLSSQSVTANQNLKMYYFKKR